jgi:outer membrane protein assembly factor BamB
MCGTHRPHPNRGDGMTCRTRRDLGLFTVLLLLPALTLPSVAAGADVAVVLSGESRAAALRLSEARKHLDEQKWPEAIDKLQALLNTAGNDLVPLSPTHSMRAGRLCQVHLASLPPDALHVYRQRYETQARKKLEQAQIDRDPDSLRKIVDETFCTRAAEKAIDLLGDLAFERARFAEAEEWWRLLAPLPDVRRDPVMRGLALVYPDPTTDPARIQAKQLLARLFRNPESDWDAQLADYRAHHAQAEGALAGRKGRYADLLRALAEERRKQGTKTVPDWTTFGGEPDRGRVIPAPPDILDRLSALCRTGPTWRFNLEKRTLQEGPPLPPAGNAAQARSLAFHPVIVGNQVLVADAQYVTAYDLRTGQSIEWYDVGRVNEGVHPSLNLPAPPDLRYTLTVSDDYVYARLGAQDIGAERPLPPAPRLPPRRGERVARRDNETFLACLSLRPDDEGKHFRWHIRGIVRDNALFEGAPLAADGRIWIASVRYQRDRCITSLDCFPNDESSQPPLRWRHDICEVHEEKTREPRYRHHLLTLVGTQLVYCSHSGAIVAVDASTGQTNWAIRYPHQSLESDEATPTRDLAPVLFAAGRLYVTPADSDRVMCLDPATGRILWEREAMQVVHLLGVGHGRLIFATSGGLRALEASDGTDSWMVPHLGGDLTPAGRGLLIGDLVLFPTTRTRDPDSFATIVYAIRQRDGQLADIPAVLHGLPAGNLAYANGCLAVADRYTLSVFVPPALLLPQRKAEARRQPDSVRALLELGRAEADSGLTEQAVETFRKAEAKGGERPASAREQRLLDRVRSERQRVLLESARRAALSQRWQDAATAIRQAAAVPLPARYRLHSLTRAAQVWEDMGQTAQALAVWQAISADEALRQIQVIDKNGTPAWAGDSASAAIARLRGERVPPREPTPLAEPTPHRTATSTGQSLPLFRTWHTTLGNDEWVLTGWRASDPELLLTGSPNRLLCRSTSTGALRWQRPLPFEPRWAGSHVATILAGGDRGVACLRRDDGQLLWHFSAPALGLHPAAPVVGVRVVLDPQTPEPLTAFQLVSGRLFFLQGQRRLFALDAQTGAVLWQQWAPDAGLRLPYPQSCFSSCYHAGPETVLLQMCGQRWLLDAATGRQIHRAADGSELWRRPPLELNEHALCVAPDNRHIVLLDSRTGAVRWTHSLTAGTTLSGEVPQVLGGGDLLLCVTPTNVGYYLQRLDRATGKPVWPQPCLLALKTLDTTAWTFDREAVYFVEGRKLIARSLADGAGLWQRPLEPAGTWRVRRVGDFLAVHPVPPAAGEQMRFRSSFGSVQWNVDASLTPEAVFPVLCCDPKTGERIERLNLRIESPARIRLVKRSTGGDRVPSLVVQASSLFAGEDGPVVRLAAPRPFVAVGGEVWGLSAASAGR